MPQLVQGNAGNYPNPSYTGSIERMPLPNPSMIMGNIGGLVSQGLASIPGMKPNEDTDFGRRLGNEIQYAAPRLGQAYASAWGNTPVGQLFKAGAESNPETDAAKKAGDFLKEQVNRFTGGNLPYFGN